MLNKYWAKKDGHESECESVGQILKCGQCKRGNVGHVPGGLHRTYCLVCGAELRKSVVHVIPSGRP